MDGAASPLQCGDDMVKGRSCLIETPPGYPDEPRAFETCSLLASTAIGFFYQAAQQRPTGEERRKATRAVFRIQSAVPCKQNQAGELVYACLRRLWRGTDVSVVGPHHCNNVFKQLVDNVPVQIVIFETSERIKAAYPPKPDLKHIRICLRKRPCLRVPGEGEKNPPATICRLDFVAQPHVLFKQGRQCFLCLKFVGRNARHNWCVRPLCQFCHRLLLRKGDYWNVAMAREFCRRNLDRGPKTTCDGCQVSVPDTCLKALARQCRN